MRALRLWRLAWGELGDPPYKKWGLIFSLAFVGAVSLLLFSLSNGLERLVQRQLVGELPQVVRLEPQRYSLGPLQVDSGLTEQSIETLRRLPGVVALYRQAHLERPALLRAQYGGQSFYSDMLVEAVDDQFFTHLSQELDLSPESLPSAGEIPALLPSGVVETLLAAMSVHTTLPPLSGQLLVGRHFSLEIGRSSFKRDEQPPAQLRCQILAISPLIGVSGPAIPYSVAQKISAQPLRPQALLLFLRDPSYLEGLQPTLQRFHLRAPQVELALEVGQALGWGRLALALFSLLLALCAGVALYSNFSLEVKINARRLALFRALGASRGDLLLIFWWRTLFIGLAGSFLGLVVGLLAGQALNLYGAFKSPLLADSPLFLPTWGSQLWIWPLLNLLCWLFSLWPVWKATCSSAILAPNAE